MIVRRPFRFAASEVEKNQRSHYVLNDLPLEHQVRGNDIVNTVIRRKEIGFRTVAYPGGVMKYEEAIVGKIPDEHRVHPEGLESYYLPEIVAPPDFSQPLILSDTFTIPALASNFVTIDFTVPIAREAAIKTAFFEVADASIDTISFNIVYGGMKSEFAVNVEVSPLESWQANMRLDEQMRVAVLVTNALAGIRSVRVALNGWIYPVHKRVV